MYIHICKSLGSLAIQKFPNLFKPNHVSFTFSVFFISSSRPEPQNHTVATAEYLVDKHRFSPQTASKISSAVKSVRNPDKSDLVLSFLKESGFSKPQIEFVIQRVPQILSSNLNSSIKPKFKLFEDFGFSLQDTVQIIVSYPWILTASVDNRLAPSILALKSVLGTDLDLSRLSKRYGSYLSRDLEKTLIPNIEFLRSRGASPAQIKAMIYKSPRFMSINPECLKKWADRVDEMGFVGKSSKIIYAIRVVSSMSLKSWEHKLELFRNLGFSDDDIMSMFRRAPHVLSYSERKIEEAIQFLLGAGKIDIAYIVNRPELLTYSTEHRFKPRLRVLEILEKKSLLLKFPTLLSLSRLSDEEFHEKFVLPFSSEVDELNMVYKDLQTNE